MPPTEEQDTPQETSMREDMEAAIEAIETDSDNAVVEDTNDEVITEDGEDEKAETSPTDTTGASEADEETAEKEQTEKAESSEAEPDASDSELKADRRPPESWPPAVREEWSKLPASVRAQVTKRENEINRALNDGAQNRKAGEKFNDLATQYAQVIAAEGATDALHGTEELFKTVATLRMGSPEQKAEKIAGFIHHYGIDLGLLDDLLVGQIDGTSAAPDGLDEGLARYLDERLAPVNNFLSRMDENTRKANYEANQAAIAEVAEFKQNHEFYTDVQNDMADLVEAAANRGITMPLQEAYDKACALNPEISAILAKRQADAALLTGQQELKAKQEAASSISGDRGGETMQGELSMRETMEQAWDAQTG